MAAVGDLVITLKIDDAVVVDAIRLAVKAEREACAKIVLDGGDGRDRLETAIAHGPNAAIAEAILARGEPTRG